MSAFQVLVVGGTHGNEVNAPWLIENWEANLNLINTYGVNFSTVIGNPNARNQNKRYIDRDLNRCFHNDLLNNELLHDFEIHRARDLLRDLGPHSSNPNHLVIDCHSTTSSMGSSLVIYGRRPADLALASLIQAKLGLPIYLHEGDASQHGFLVESWPCGLVLEIGPVAQSLLDFNIVFKTRLVLEVIFQQISYIQQRMVNFPKKLIIHRHLKSIDIPRNSFGLPEACIHPDLLGKDWLPLAANTPLFLRPDGFIYRYEYNDSPVPVFINEAAYLEKKIALSLTKKEIWPFNHIWKDTIFELINSSI